MRVGASHPGHAVDSTLAALATLTAAWPISTLLARPTWLRGTILLLAVIVLAGVGARRLALHGWQVLTAQLTCLVLAASALYGQGHLWHGLPSLQTAGFAGRLIHEAVTTAQGYAAPAPTTPGLIFVVGCSLGLAGLLVDYLAVTRQSPSLAGLPLLTVFLAVVANRGSTLSVLFFLAAAAMWLILLARTGSAVLRRWGTTVPAARTPVPQKPEPTGFHEYASLARVLGAVALVAAVAVPVLLPQAPPRFLASGLGRSSSGSGNGGQGVAFSQSIDLATDLKSSSRAPVLQYTTPDTSPPPLRVAVGSAYRADPGVWLPWGRPWRSPSGKPELLLNPTVPEPTGLSPDVPRRAFVMNVSHNWLEDPFLASPYPLTAAEVPGIAWGSDYQTQSIRVAQVPDSYRISYLRLEPTAAMLRSAPPLSDRERFLNDLDLRLEQPYATKVTALAHQLTDGQSSAYDKAMAIQQYLRADGGFTYSLTLAPPARDQTGHDAGYDSLTNFLVTKKGYCVQFATAMVMMSRAAGIPARMDIGFLPGTETKGIWTVTAADAHAWPELYLDGIGWTRFEPTPSRATPPVYATPATSSGAAGGDQPQAKATAPAPRITARKDLGAPSAGDTRARVGPGPTSVVRWLTSGWRPVLLGALIVVLGSLVVPTAALWRRRRSLTRARTAAERVEVQWELLTSSLGDLGIAPSPSRTPRQLHAYYDREALLEGADSQALGRVVQTLEGSRYAASPPPAGDLTGDARVVLRAAANTRDGRSRLRASLWPSSGIIQLRSTGGYVAARVRAPLRHLGDVLHRRS